MTVKLMDGQEQLDRRAAIGNALMKRAWGRTPEGDDREPAAADAISDILTALLGPAGTTSFGGTIRHDENRIAAASDLLDHALESYRGDAEDYVRQPEPGQYGWEES